MTKLIKQVGFSKCDKTTEEESRGSEMFPDAHGL